MDQSPSSALPKPEIKTLRFTTKFTYGVGELSAAIPGNILSFFFLFFLTNIAGLSASKAGTVMLISKAWDAINDPLIGWLSDHTRSPWGRRYPWIVCGAVPLGLFFMLLWIVPTFSQDATLNQQALFGYYGVLGVLFYAAFTSVLLPFSALAPELTQDYHERTSLISFKSAFSVGGAILALVLAQVIFSVVEHPSQKYLVLGIVCATCAVVSAYVSVLGTHRVVLNQQEPETVNESVRPSLPWRSQIGYIFTNRPFLYVMGIYLCSWLGVQITAAILPYFVINWMGLPDHHFTQVAIAVQGTALAMMFIWSFVSKRLGKKAVYLIGMPLLILAEAGLFFLQPGQVGLLYGLAVLAGFGIATAYLIPWSMLPDVVDLDELNSGQRREGIFYGFMVLFQKMGFAIALFLVGKILDWAGFISSVAGEPNPVQPESALFAIRMIIGPLPTLILLCGLVFSYFYPITREVHVQILHQLWERNHQS
ncbi:sugar (Glycoside-Pentoside-Hexuronide) transporter subfamily [Coleofasciculus chthonoplastes PCC 7420]|uniref:Sugar (Glycoside-Pentoside-Hexuronide) transporter subfamily n=2 Tax=Coleofasciculus TaxID=669368 RepID=B4W0Y2_9CYAN|nr:MFS transporter [Coleofasciculus chthonoplastes]EDX72205.1 sugar (Glycoside-Pentoside-Hexuronide) transporter subfamily [Coleofasciculus chthonoplastes PCC 7420]